VELFKQVGFFAGDAREEGLELEPACQVASDLFPGGKGGGVIDLFWGADPFRQQLSLTAAIHGDEPPGGLFDAVADGEQAVILENGGFALAEGLGDTLAFRCFVDDAGEIGENGVVFVKRASILRDGIE